MRNDRIKFDLQLFAENARLLKPETFDELSLVFSQYKGSTWAPRNQSSRVIAIKGSASNDTESAKKPTFLQRFAEVLTKGWMVKDDTPDNIDHDGDGAEDYEQIVRLMMSTYYDLQAALNISGDTARSAAVVASVDTFLANLDDVRDGGDGNVMKAGRKHSAATIARLKKVRAGVDGLGAELDELLGLEDDEETSKAGELEDDAGEVLASGETLESLETDVEAFTAEAIPDDETIDGAAIGKANQDMDGPWADPGYQSDKRKRYPLNNAAKVRSALRYIGVQKNRDKYSTDDLKKVETRIHAAAKKFGIDVDKAKSMPDPGERDEAYSALKSSINMTASEIESWLEKDDSRMAGTGVGHANGTKLVGLLRKKKGDWTSADVGLAKKVSAYIARHKGEGPAMDDKGKLTPSAISLRNWGYDPVKTTKGAPIETADSADADAGEDAILKAAIAQIGDRVNSAITAAIASLEPKFTDVTKAVADLRADAERMRGDFDARIGEVTTQATKANAALAAVVGDAAKPTTSGGLESLQTDGTSKAHAAISPEPKAKAAPTPPPGLSPLAGAIHAQRVAARNGQ